MIEDVLMTTKRDREKIKVMDSVLKRKITMKDASIMLSLSYRQIKRLKKAYKNYGDKGLIHKSRGKPSHRKILNEIKEEIISIYRNKYNGFGPTLAAEKLIKEGFKIDHETLRNWLIEKEVWKKKRNRACHRQRRERKHHFGEMIQIDGSHHNWFGKDFGKSCLMNMVDDSTKTTLSYMDVEETTDLAMITLWKWIEKYGIPLSLYCDKKNVFVTDREATIEEQLRGEEPLTFFGKACKKLGIRIIIAASPQAKGRVERNHGVYQDRFVKELHLQNIKDIDLANKLLISSFIKELNDKFRIEPIEKSDYHRKVSQSLDLRTVFCYEYDRKVSKDWVVQFNKRYFQIEKNNKVLPRTGKKVKVSEWLDKSIHIYFKDKELKIKEITEMINQMKKAS
jgi:transposase